MTSFLKILKGLLTTSEMKSHLFIHQFAGFLMDWLMFLVIMCIEPDTVLGTGMRVMIKASSVSVLQLLLVEGERQMGHCEPIQAERQ